MAAEQTEDRRMDEPEADEDDGKMVDLVSQEGDNFQVEKRVAKMSELVKTMIPEEVTI